MNRSALIVERALELGFVRAGITPAGPLSDAPHLDRWLEEGFHGEMRWMENHRGLRTDTSKLEPGTRSVIALAIPYGPPLHDEPAHDAVSRYAKGDDYHDVVRDRLRTLAAFVTAETGEDVWGRPAVDSAPLLERNVAVDAGLGWLGKSAMVLHQDDGPYMFLAELLVPIELEPVGTRHPDRCGRCTRCIDLCPTGAIVAPYRVDARRCISYLTIELRGPIPRDLRAPIGHRLFGCDVCQSVCPWSSRERPQPWEAFVPRPEASTDLALFFLTADRDAFLERTRRSPLRRAKRHGLARNAAVVLGNRGDRSAVAPLAHVLQEDPEALVRGHSAWALGVLGGSRARNALDRAQRQEENPWVLEEIRFALEVSSQT